MEHDLEYATEQEAREVLKIIVGEDQEIDRTIWCPLAKGYCNTNCLLRCQPHVLHSYTNKNWYVVQGFCDNPMWRESE